MIFINNVHYRGVYFRGKPVMVQNLYNRDYDVFALIILKGTSIVSHMPKQPTKF